MPDRKKKSDSRKLESPEAEIQTVKTYVEREVGHLKRRVDQPEKSTHLVLGHSSKVLELYSTAETSGRLGSCPKTRQRSSERSIC